VFGDSPWPTTADRPVYAVGIGPGHLDYVHPLARRILRMADVTVGFETVLGYVEALIEGESLACTYDTEADRLGAFARRVADGARGAGALMGDPNVSGTTFVTKVEAALGRELRIVPAVSAVQVAASRARVPLESSTIVSLHTRGDLQPQLDRLVRDAGRRPLLVLPRPYDYMPERIARELLARGSDPELPALVLESLTLPAETVTTTTLEDLAATATTEGSAFSDLSILVVRNAQ
jgi:cobalt-precorrin-7 (C5)-methyltransferase